ncbi:MAG: 2OG-Fe(II) oxygenase [Bryobacteraceae bacterium]
MELAARIRALPWQDMEASLWERGYAHAGPLLNRDECDALAGLYARDELFRSRIDMARYRFGAGDYKYFGYPLPDAIRTLREHFYPPLAGIANAWMEALASDERYPETLAELAARCHAEGQTKATPLLLHYEAGGYNCLHQDIYGDIAFPMQVVCFLSQAGRDFTGGDFLLVEQRPRAQSIGEAIHASQGDIVVFTTRYRPVKGSRGYYRANLRHGVSRLLSGTRYTLGIIFHDAR